MVHPELLRALCGSVVKSIFDSSSSPCPLWLWDRGHPEIPESKILSPGIDSIKIAVCAAYKIDGSGLLSSRRGTANEAGNVAGYLCRRLSDETPARIAREFHLSNFSSVSSLVSRVKKALAHDVRLRHRVGSLEQQLIKAHNQT